MTQTAVQPDSPFFLGGQLALVTGGATGIGQAIALGLARAGADVAVTAHHADAAATRQGVESAGRRCHVEVVDLGQNNVAQGLIERVEHALGPIGILVNNAGIIRRADAEQLGEQEWQDVIDLDLGTVWRLSQAAGRGMLARGGGKIINVASLLAFQGGIRVASYTAAKHGVAGLTKALANEWAARGVNVNAVAPGYVATANTAALRADPQRAAGILARIPAGRWGNPEDVAGAAVFLASRAAASVHGHVLTVDGGWLAR